MFNLRSVDLNLLPVFEAAYEERSLSRAADRLAMTQSAVSHALGRLRSVFRDELFVRQARGVLPTPTADRIYAAVRSALGTVREAIADARGFDPKTSERRFFVAIPHPLGPMIAVRLREQLAAIAPKVVVGFSTRSRPLELERGLREGRIDAAIDWLMPEGVACQASTLFDDGVVAVARHGHPALRRQGTAALRDYEFVSLRARIEGENPVLGIAEWQRLKLKIGLEVSEIIEIFMVASQSDLCGLIPRSMEKVARELLGLRVLRASPRTPSVPVKLIWHASRERDEGHAFLRRQLTIAARKVA